MNNFAELCRLCLVKSSKTSEEIFFPIDEDFEKKFEEVTNIALNIQNSDCFPVNVCISCVTEFEGYYNYRKGIVENQKRLNRLVGKKEKFSRVKVEDMMHKSRNTVMEEESQLQNESKLDELIREKDEEIEHEMVAIEYEEVNEQYIHDQSDIFEEALHSDSVDENNYQFDPDEEAIQNDEEETTIEDEEISIQHDEEEEVEYVDSTDEYIEEMEHASGDDDRILFAIAADSDLTDIDTNCIIIKSDDSDLRGEMHQKRKYTKKESKEKKYKCWKCNAAFPYRLTLKKHLHTMHNIECDKNTCLMCGRQFNEYSDFLSHVKTHTRKSECDICKLQFVSEEKMQAHYNRVHRNDSNERCFKCEYCNALFKRKEHVNSHIIYRHTDRRVARSFKCKECTSSFLTRQDLKNHEKSHTQLKKYCAYCDYDCRDLKSIKLHCIKIHNTTKVYKCECDEAFELFKDYQSHRKNCFKIIDSTT